MPDNLKTISVIIVNYYMGEEVKALLRSILRHTSGIEYEVIIVDNDSKDEASLNLPKEFGEDGSNVIFHRLDHNAGFAAGCNKGASLAKGKQLFFLNPDALLNSNLISEASEAFSQLPEQSLMGIRSGGDGIIDYSAGYFPNFFFELLNIWFIGRIAEALIMGLRRRWTNEVILKTDWVLGASIVMSRETFSGLDGFDEDYFLYFEEMDLCKRLKKSGGNVLYHSALTFTHLGSVSTRKNYEFFTTTFYRSKLLFIRKHYSPAAIKVHTLLMLLQSVNQIIFWLLLYPLKKEKALGKIRGFKKVIRHIMYKEAG